MHEDLRTRREHLSLSFVFVLFLCLGLLLLGVVVVAEIAWV